MKKYFLAVIGKSNCGKTSVIKKINALLAPLLEQEGYTAYSLNRWRSNEIAFMYSCPGKPSTGIFSHGDIPSTIFNLCTSLRECQLIIGASRHSKRQFNIIRKTIQQQKRELHVLYKTGKSKDDQTEDDEWILQQYQEKISFLLPF